MEETISLKEIFEVIKKRFLLITAFVLGAALIAAVVSFFVLTPTYEASSQFIVNQKQQDAAEYSVNDIRTNVELISTYNVIITNSAILDEVVDILDLDVSAGSLAKNIKVSSEQNSQIVTVTTTDPSPYLAADIVNTTVEVFQEKIPQIMDGADNVKILSPATVAPEPTPVAPNPKLNIAIAIVLGGMIGVGLAFLLEYLDNTITTEEDIEKYLGIPVLGTISTIEESDVREGQQAFREKHTRRGGFNVQSQKKTS